MIIGIRESSCSVPASATTSTRFLPSPPFSPSRRQSRSLPHETYARADASFLNISSSCSIIMIALGFTLAGQLILPVSLSEAGYCA